MAGFLIAGAFQHPQHLQNPDAAGTGRRRGDDPVSAIGSGQRRALDSGVVLQIGQRDQAAVAGHRFGEFLRRLAFVEFLRAVLRDAVQRARELGLRQSVAGVPISPVLLEDALGFRVLRQVAGALQRFRQRIAHWETLRRQGGSGFNEIGPFAAAVFAMSQLESAHGAGNAGGFPAVQAFAGGLSGSIQIHVARGFLGSALAKIDEGGTAVGETDQHESAAAQVSGVGMRHGERESDGDRGVHGIAAVLQDLDAHVGRQRLLRAHHGVAGANRLTRVPRRRNNPPTKTNVTSSHRMHPILANRPRAKTMPAFRLESKEMPRKDIRRDERVPCTLPVRLVLDRPGRI